MKLVLVSCCAPCSAGAIKQLADGAIPDVDDFVVLFFNPNIYPADEYKKRMAEQIKYCDAIGVKHVELEYDHDAWRDAVRGLEAAPERGARCSACFGYRFARAARWARENGYDAVASVLGVSRHKDQSQVDRAAIAAIDLATSIPPAQAGGGTQCRGVAKLHTPRYTQFALNQSKTLKRNMTDAERLLWHYLRGRRDFSFRKQAPIRNYIVDFVCLSKKLIIELDGAQHGDVAGRAHDAARDKFLMDSGYRVLRFWNDEVFNNMDMVLDTIYLYLATPSQAVPDSPRPGGGNYSAVSIPPARAGGDGDSHRGVADTNIKYIPIKWDEGLRQKIGRESNFYRQNYCGCEFSIRKV